MDNRGQFFQIDALEQQLEDSGRRYREFLRVPMMSAGMYMLPAGAIDTQSPHNEDELYYVVGGHAQVTVGGEERTVSVGSLIFVPAKTEHRFHDILEDLSVLVLFAPAES